MERCEAMLASADILGQLIFTLLLQIKLSVTMPLLSVETRSNKTVKSQLALAADTSFCRLIAAHGEHPRENLIDPSSTGVFGVH